MPPPDPRRILLHTIAVEPERWSERRVARPLVEVLPDILAAGFPELEVFEPHAERGAAAELSAGLRQLGMKARILSSYLQMNPARQGDRDFSAAAERAIALAQTLGCEAMRIYPGRGIHPEDAAGVRGLTRRTRELLARWPEGKLLVETHHDSLGDDPAALARWRQELGEPRVGFAFQPVSFTPEAVREQWRLQRPWSNHFHLQNRNAADRFCRLAEGTAPWEQILADAAPGAGASLEFVPAGMKPPADFDLAETLAEARADAAWAAAMLR